MRSKCLIRLVAASAALLSSPAMALSVFVCEPEWKALIAAHAPDAMIYSATTANQDPHYVQARPSLIAKFRQADMAMCSGAELEVGWLPMLQARSGNPLVQESGPNMIYASNHVRMLDTHNHVDRAMGDIHAHGNPHVQFAVQSIPKLSKVITTKLQQIDPDNALQYQVNGMRFRRHWNTKVSEWKQKSASLRGKRVVGYHATYRYLFEWLGVSQVADLEPKPGISPTASHLQSLVRLDYDEIDAIVYSTYQDSRPANWLQKQINVPVVALPLTVRNDETLDSLIDNIIDSLLVNTVLAEHSVIK
ncbi:zinc ABC transporter substrate-binding protein [Photobacterium sp. SDRW27]|uniref:metal ABC transporter solute-binding protein, Zn/Mn family n=1 Tax=Photobacterium obscurum TaxID=2829490 RepID=UPI002243117A|nr:zinc ABC transporter substrate-binding protein [Photobacterium obscurum]MCW8328549.1 zinc ABC transporter substrate-binding protein [Photobacterium obscurum]